MKLEWELEGQGWWVHWPHWRLHSDVSLSPWHQWAQVLADAELKSEPHGGWRGARAKDKYFPISLRVAGEVYNKFIFLSAIVILIDKGYDPADSLLIRGSSNTGRTYLRGARLPSQTHLHIFPNVFLPVGERKTKPLTLTRPIFSYISRYFWPGH